MTNETVTDPSSPIDPDHQAALIIANFATWLTHQPGRRIVLSHDAAGWQCDLEERRSTRGNTLQEATAQGAQVAAVEVDVEVAP
jgi:hypothetical protein